MHGRHVMGDRELGFVVCMECASFIADGWHEGPDEDHDALLKKVDAMDSMDDFRISGWTDEIRDIRESDAECSCCSTRDDDLRCDVVAVVWEG